jgi:hypothetical protein
MSEQGTFFPGVRSTPYPKRDTDKYADTNARWRAKNRERVRRKARQWALNNPDKVKASQLKLAARTETKYRLLKRMAAKRSIQVEITFAEYSGLVSSGFCFHCGGGLPVQGHGIDRRDSRPGYLPNNCVPCCSSCNDTKGHLESAGFTYPRIGELMKELIAKRVAQISSVDTRKAS